MNILKEHDTEPLVVINPTDMRLDPIYIRVYILWMNLFMQIIIPFLILIILNTFIYKKIKGFEKRCRESREGNVSISEIKVSLRQQSSQSFLNGCSSTTVTPIMPRTNIRRCSSCTSFPNFKKDITNRTKDKNRSPLLLQNNGVNNDKNVVNIEEEFELTSFNPSRKDSNPYKSELNLSSLYNSKELEKQQIDEKNRLLSTVSSDRDETSAEKEAFVGRNCKKDTRIKNIQETHVNYNKSELLIKSKPKNISFDCEVKPRNESKRKKKKSNKFSSAGTSLRKREVALAKISLYIVFVMLICHGVRLIPNTYEMIETYTEVKYLLYI